MEIFDSSLLGKQEALSRLSGNSGRPKRPARLVSGDEAGPAIMLGVPQRLESGGLCSRVQTLHPSYKLPGGKCA